MSGNRNKRDGCVAESKRGLKCVLYCKCMYTANAVSTVPENSGMSADSSHCWDGVVVMSAVKLKKGVSECLFYMHVCRSHICMHDCEHTYVCMYKRVRVYYA